MKDHKGGIVPFACSDYYMFATSTAFHLAAFPTPVAGTKSFTFSLKGLSAAEKWDITTNGVRAFMFKDDLHTLVADLTKTVAMFAPLAMTKKCCSSPSATQTADNVDFLERCGVGADGCERGWPGGSTCVCVCVCMFMCVRVYVCMYVCMGGGRAVDGLGCVLFIILEYMHSHTHTHTHTFFPPFHPPQQDMSTSLSRRAPRGWSR